MKAHINFLTADSLGGRCIHTKGVHIAASYIKAQLHAGKISSTAVNGYEQTFVANTENDVKEKVTNLVATVNNHRPKAVLLLAHYDHLCVGSRYSKEPGSTKILHGADDNASGVATLLEIAKNIKASSNKWNYNFCFAFTSGHEEGLTGARYLYASNLVDTNNIAWVINLDMLGRLENVLTINIENSDTSAIRFNATGYTVVKRNVAIEGDQTVFANHGIKTAYFSTGYHSDYHTSGDVASKINYVGMYHVMENLQSLLVKLFGK